MDSRSVRCNVVGQGPASRSVECVFQVGGIHPCPEPSTGTLGGTVYPVCLLIAADQCHLTFVRSLSARCWGILNWSSPCQWLAVCSAENHVSPGVHAIMAVDWAGRILLIEVLSINTELAPPLYLRV